MVRRSMTFQQACGTVRARVRVCWATRGAHDRVWTIFSAGGCDDMVVHGLYPIVKLFIVGAEEGAETGEGLDLLGLLEGVF